MIDIKENSLSNMRPLITTKVERLGARNLGVSLLVISLLALSACAKDKIVSTSDNSADYKSARSLPPLKKPSRDSVVQSQQKVEVEPTPEIIAGPDATAVADAEIIPEPLIVEETIAITEPEDVIETAVIETPQETVSRGDQDYSSISAKVITPNEGVARLQISSDFGLAWNYLSNNLKRSDITIFSRNRAAGRFSIGCADIAAAPVVEKKGGWSFLNRKAQQNEYCSLQAASTRGTTILTVLNRAGEEVSGSYASAIFTRILNN